MTYGMTFFNTHVPEVWRQTTMTARRRQWHPTPVLLPGKSHGRRSLVDCSPWGREESDMTEWLHFQFSLSYIGEGNDNPLQCSCLENPRDARAWWAAVYGVAQSRTRLKWLSSSSSSSRQHLKMKIIMLTISCCLKGFNHPSLASGEWRSILTQHHKNIHVSAPILFLSALAPTSSQHQNIPFA